MKTGVLKNQQFIDDYIVNFLADLDHKFKRNKKTLSLIEKHIVQLLIFQVIKDSHIFEDTLYFHLPFSSEVAWIDLKWPMDLDPNVKNLIKRKMKNIEAKLAKTSSTNWDKLVSQNIKLFSLSELIGLYNKKLLKEKTWTMIQDNFFLLYRKDKEFNVSQEQFLFKMSCLLQHRDQLKNNTKKELLSDSNMTLGYQEAKRLFNQTEKDEFRKKTIEKHYLQPGLTKIRGTSIEGILNDSLLCAHPDYAIFYQEESQQQGFDLEVIKRSLKNIRISSKTGNIARKGIIHLSASRTQKLSRLEDKTEKVNKELASISIITACLVFIDGNRKRYVRLTLDPKKLLFKKDWKNWKTKIPSRKDQSHGWKKYSYNSGTWGATITEGKSHQFDFYIPLSFFEVVDEFYVD